MKLFQIEEPDGSPSDPEATGAAVGIDLSGAVAQVAVAVGGNPALLSDREGFELSLPVPAGEGGDWEGLLEGARLRAERALARPVTHAAIVIAGRSAPALAERVRRAAEAIGLEPLRVLGLSEVAGRAGAEPPVHAAACLAEDLAPRGEGG